MEAKTIKNTGGGSQRVPHATVAQVGTGGTATPRSAHDTRTCQLRVTEENGGYAIRLTADPPLDTYSAGTVHAALYSFVMESAVAANEVLAILPTGRFSCGPGDVCAIGVAGRPAMDKLMPGLRTVMQLAGHDGFPALRRLLQAPRAWPCIRDQEVGFAPDGPAWTCAPNLSPESAQSLAALALGIGLPGHQPADDIGQQDAEHLHQRACELLLAATRVPQHPATLSLIMHTCAKLVATGSMRATDAALACLARTMAACLSAQPGLWETFEPAIKDVLKALVGSQGAPCVRAARELLTVAIVQERRRVDALLSTKTGQVFFASGEAFEQARMRAFNAAVNDSFLPSTLEAMFWVNHAAAQQAGAQGDQGLHQATCDWVLEALAQIPGEEAAKSLSTCRAALEMKTPSDHERRAREALGRAGFQFAIDAGGDAGPRVNATADFVPDRHAALLLEVALASPPETARAVLLYLAEQPFLPPACQSTVLSELPRHVLAAYGSEPPAPGAQHLLAAWANMLGGSGAPNWSTVRTVTDICRVVGKHDHNLALAFLDQLIPAGPLFNTARLATRIALLRQVPQSLPPRQWRELGREAEEALGATVADPSTQAQDQGIAQAMAVELTSHRNWIAAQLVIQRAAVKLKTYVPKHVEQLDKLARQRATFWLADILLNEPALVDDPEVRTRVVLVLDAKGPLADLLNDPSTPSPLFVAAACNLLLRSIRPAALYDPQFKKLLAGAMDLARAAGREDIAVETFVVLSNFEFVDEKRRKTATEVLVLTRPGLDLEGSDRCRWLGKALHQRLEAELDKHRRLLDEPGGETDNRGRYLVAVATLACSPLDDGQGELDFLQELMEKKEASCLKLLVPLYTFRHLAQQRDSTFNDERSTVGKPVARTAFGTLANIGSDLLGYFTSGVADRNPWDSQSRAYEDSDMSWPGGQQAASLSLWTKEQFPTFDEKQKVLIGQAHKALAAALKYRHFADGTTKPRTIQQRNQELVERMEASYL
jgi:hypothetical protein